MQKWSEFVLTDADFPASGATVTVYLTGTTTKASIYSDDGVTVAANPQTTNSLGFVSFFVANNNYDINYAGPGITTWTRNRVALFDPFESSVGDAPVTFKGNWTSGSVNPSNTGVLRLAAGDALNFRNNANSADINGVSKTAGDAVSLGGAAGVVIGGGNPLLTSSTTGTGQIVLQTSPALVTPSIGAAFATGLTDNGTTLTKRIRVSQGTAYSGSDTAIALSAGWGSTATVSSASGFDQNLSFITTANGSGIAANPTITITFKDGTFTGVPLFLVARNDLITPLGTPPHTWSETATTLTVTFNGTPTSGNNYTYRCLSLGR